MNKIALVTGGSRGKGKVIAKILKENDFTVIITSRNKERLEKTAKELRVDYFKADVSNLKEIQNLIKYITKKYKKIDVLVNNAQNQKSHYIPRYTLSSSQYAQQVLPPPPPIGTYPFLIHGQFSL